MNRIKSILEEKGVKQTWLAEKLNKSYNMVNSYVQNRRQPSLDDLYKIARILSVDVRELLVLDQNDNKMKKYQVMGEKEIELLSEKIHKLYCKQYLKDNGKPYWTEGNYFKLDEKAKEYDRNIARFILKNFQPNPITEIK